MTSATSINAVIYIPKMTARWSLALLLLPLLLLLTNVDAYQIRHVPIDTLSPVVGSRGVVSANGSARGHDHQWSDWRWGSFEYMAQKRISYRHKICLESIPE